jgi:ribonuclease HI
MPELKSVTIYTDGACIDNPGPGGYGVVLLCEGHRKELSGGFRLTTNNRMEMMAALIGLQALKFRCQVSVYTDSQYLTDGIMKGWAKRWRANGWRRKREKIAINWDLWEKLLNICDRHCVMFQWVPGHAGVPENERCDVLSGHAALGSKLPADEGYETTPSPPPTPQGNLFAAEVLV